jgi:hypothetical protein
MRPNCDTEIVHGPDGFPSMSECVSNQKTDPSANILLREQGHGWNVSALPFNLHDW